jgi:myosin heavy subunit
MKLKLKLKRNEMKWVQAFTGANVLRQLRYAGVFEAVTIRRTGFPYRMTHAEYFKRSLESFHFHFLFFSY